MTLDRDELVATTSAEFVIHKLKSLGVIYKTSFSINDYV